MRLAGGPILKTWLQGYNMPVVAPRERTPISPGEGEQKLARAQGLLENCHACEWRCGNNRPADQPGKCRLGATTRVVKQYASLTEEPEVIPALRVYLAGCNFRCPFCDTAPECLDPQAGRPLSITVFEQEMQRIAPKGCRSVSVLGGEPTLHPHALLQMAAALPPGLNLVVNTNLYMTPEVLELLDGAVGMYLSDYKFGNDECAERLAGAVRYGAVVRRNLTWIASRVPLVVRHLLMPGHLDCCFRPIVDWLAENLPGTRLRLYTGFVPCWQAGPAGLGRLNTRAESEAAVSYLRKVHALWEADSEKSG